MTNSEVYIADNECANAFTHSQGVRVRQGWPGRTKCMQRVDISRLRAYTLSLLREGMRAILHYFLSDWQWSCSWRQKKALARPLLCHSLKCKVSHKELVKGRLHNLPTQTQIQNTHSVRALRTDNLTRKKETAKV